MYQIFHSGVGHLDNPPGRGSGRYAFGSGKDPRAAKKAGLFRRKPKPTKEDKERLKILEQARKEKAERENIEKLKRKIIDKADAKSLFKYQQYFTTEELKEATDKIRAINDAKSAAIRNKELNVAFSNMDSLLAPNGKLNKMTNWVETGLNIYDKVDTIKKISNNYDVKDVMKKFSVEELKARNSEAILRYKKAEADIKNVEQGKDLKYTNGGGGKKDKKK